ncbi:MAG: VCBS repeat-containing protein [Myxococcota bacterium]
MLRIALLLLSAGAARAGELPFAALQTISSAADSVRSLHLADVDGDGRLDVLSASAFDDTVAWHRNELGAGPPWTANLISSSAGGARSVFAADLDGDGDLDALSAAELDDAITWYENPSWTVHAVSSTALGATSVHAADLNGDGAPDVLSASAGDDKIAWYENQGGVPPVFVERVIDEDPDGAGPLRGFAAGPQAIWAADVDGDGDLDVLSASQADDTIAWFENASAAGDGSAWIPHEIATGADGARAVFAADVDGDGAIDVLSASELDDTIVWYANVARDGSSWTPHTIAAGANGASAVFAVDADGDGDVDVFSASEQGGSLDWYENTAGDGSAWTARAISSVAGARAVVVADLDGDGDVDAVSASAQDDTVGWHENVGLHRNAAFPVELVVSTSAEQAHAVFAADVDGDGDVDVLSASELDDEIAWYENLDGLGSSWLEHSITTGADGGFSVFAADVDGDGHLDALSASQNDDTIAWYQNPAGDGPPWAATVITSSADLARSVFAADLDGDGDVDALSASEFDDKIA